MNLIKAKVMIPVKTVSNKLFFFIAIKRVGNAASNFRAFSENTR